MNRPVRYAAARASGSGSSRAKPDLASQCAVQISQRASDIPAARALHDRLLEINKAVFFDTNPIPIKYMM